MAIQFINVNSYLNHDSLKRIRGFRYWISSWMKQTEIESRPLLTPEQSPWFTPSWTRGWRLIPWGALPLAGRTACLISIHPPRPWPLRALPEFASSWSFLLEDSQIYRAPLISYKNDNYLQLKLRQLWSAYANSGLISTRRLLLWSMRSRRFFRVESIAL